MMFSNESSTRNRQLPQISDHQASLTALRRSSSLPSARIDQNQEIFNRSHSLPPARIDHSAKSLRGPVNGDASFKVIEETNAGGMPCRLSNIKSDQAGYRVTVNNARGSTTDMKLEIPDGERLESVLEKLGKGECRAKILHSSEGEPVCQLRKNVGLKGGGHVELPSWWPWGIFRSPSSDEYRRLGDMLGSGDTVLVEGERMTKLDCYLKALELDPCNIFVRNSLMAMLPRTSIEQSQEADHQVLPLDLSSEELNVRGDKMCNCVETRYGTVSYATNFGVRAKTNREKQHNEDAVAINQSGNIFGVMDGLGGHSKGHVAARALAKSIEEASETASVAAIAQRAGQYIRENTSERDGAATCAIVGKINDQGLLEIYSSGNCKCIVLDENRQVVFDSEYDSPYHCRHNKSVPNSLAQASIPQVDAAYEHYRLKALTGALTASQLEHLFKVDWLNPKQKQTIYDGFHHGSNFNQWQGRAQVTSAVDRDDHRMPLLGRIPLKQNYRVIMISDGVGDNLTTSEIQALNSQGDKPTDVWQKIFNITFKQQRLAAKYTDQRNKETQPQSLRTPYFQIPKDDNLSIMVYDLQADRRAQLSFTNTSEQHWEAFKERDSSVYNLVKKYEKGKLHELEATDFDGVYENRLEKLCDTFLQNEDQIMVDQMKWDLMDKGKDLSDKLSVSIWKEFSPRTQRLKNREKLETIKDEINVELKKINIQAEEVGKKSIQALNDALEAAKNNIGNNASSIIASLNSVAWELQGHLSNIASNNNQEFQKVLDLIRKANDILRQSETVSERVARNTTIKTIQESIPNIVEELIKKINPELENLEKKIEASNYDAGVENEQIRSCINQIKDDLNEVSFRITTNKESNDRFMLQLHRDICQLYESDKNIFNELDQKIKDIARSMSDFFSCELIEDLKKQRERTEEKEAELYSLNDSPRGLIFHDVFKGQLRALREGALASTSDAVKLSGRKASTAANVTDAGAEIVGTSAKIATGIDVSGSVSKVITTPIKMIDEHSQKTSHAKRIIGSMRLLTDENIDRFSRKIPLQLRNGDPVNLDTMQPPKKSDVKKFVSKVVHFVTNKHALKRLSSNEEEYWFIKIAINTAEELFRKLSEIKMGSEFNPNEEERLFNAYLDHAIHFARNKIVLGK